ncbi:condensation domain-containing protein, partial [Cupriavidus numazuensis]|uniref:condensation domain-containing protein n=1 Tax=Cupriavidus numazuensis TaxID=221992 RepID=UPI001BA5CD80
PLLRVGLLRLAAGEHVLVVVMHHIVSDGWSVQLIVDEFTAQYRARTAGEAPALAELPVQYADYAVWQRNWLEAGEKARQLAYWRAQLGGEGAEQPVLQLATDHPRHAQGHYRSARHSFALPASLLGALRQGAQAQGATVFMLLLAGYHALLHRYSAQEDIRIGVPVANRQRVETEGLVGLFVNSQVLRARVSGRMTLAQLVQQVREAA